MDRRRQAIDDPADVRRKTVRIRPAFHHECAQRFGCIEAQPAAALRKTNQVHSTGKQLLFESGAMRGRGDHHRRPAGIQRGAKALNDIRNEQGIVRIEVRGMAAVGSAQRCAAHLVGKIQAGFRRIRRKRLHGQGQRRSRGNRAAPDSCLTSYALCDGPWPERDARK